MNATETGVLVVGGCAAFSALVWCAALALSSWASGWRRLARAFGNASLIAGAPTRFLSARIGHVDYSGILNVGGRRLWTRPHPDADVPAIPPAVVHSVGGDGNRASRRHPVERRAPRVSLGSWRSPPHLRAHARPCAAVPRQSSDGSGEVLVMIDLRHWRFSTPDLASFGASTRSRSERATTFRRILSRRPHTTPTAVARSSSSSTKHT